MTFPVGARKESLTKQIKRLKKEQLQAAKLASDARKRQASGKEQYYPKIRRMRLAEGLTWAEISKATFHDAYKHWQKHILLWDWEVETDAAIAANQRASRQRLLKPLLARWECQLEEYGDEDEERAAA